MRLALAFLLLAAAPVLGTPAESFAAALADARLLPPDVRIVTRYADLSTVPAANLMEVKRVWRGHVSQLSRAPDLVYPRLVNATLMAFIIDDYGWDRKVWEKLADIDPFYHEQVLVVVGKEKVKETWAGGKDKTGREFPKGLEYVVERDKKVIKADHARWAKKWGACDLAVLLDTNAPLVDGLWLFVQTARQLSLRNKQTGAGYYDFLQVKDRNEFDKLVEFDQKKSIRFGREKRAALDVSDVADQGRQVEQFQALGGGYWRTLDTDDSANDSNPVRLLGRGEYRHIAEEIYAVLPNGFFAYFLCDQNGVRQDFAPDFIGPNDAALRKGRRGRIDVCVACIQCHTDGLRPIDDWVRRTMKSPLALQTPDYKKFLEVKRQYFSDLSGQLVKDRSAYAAVVWEATGWRLPEWSLHFSATWNLYAETPWSAVDVARQLGCSEAKLVQALRIEAATAGKLDLVLSGLAEGGRLRTTHFEELVPEIMRILGGP